MVVENSNRRDGNDDLKDQANCKVGNDAVLELQIWTGCVKVGRPVRKVFVGNLLNWSTVRRGTEILGRKVSMQVFAVKRCKWSKLDCPPNARLLLVPLEFESKKLSK